MNEIASGVVRNILFIMCDQLRADYLSCYGAQRLHTPNIDALAARGTRFERCVVQAPVCGPSRMSTYTGRYVSSHGATWNFVPLPVCVPTLGDHLREAGLRVAVVGKTHAVGDREAMDRLGVDPISERGVLLDNAGFEPWARDDGILPDARLARTNPPYNRYLQMLGYPERNAWHDQANSAQGASGQLLSGWQMRHANLPARVSEAHSETAWATDRAIEFIRDQGEAPWCLHLSYIKPHWPYIAPAPYHAMFGPDDVPPARLEPEGGEPPHPVLHAFRQHPESLAFAREEVRRTVIPTYMGLVKQVDDHIGRLMGVLQGLGRLDDTLIVFTSDHGDLLGDHKLGEKELFYEGSVRVPLIITGPRCIGGQVDQSLTQSIDLLPTFVEALGRPDIPHWLEGQSLWKRLTGIPDDECEIAVSEFDYSFYAARRQLDVDIRDARATMILTPQWKYVRFERFRPQLFDVQQDPDELCDLGGDSGHAATRAEMEERIAQWRARLRHRVTMSDAQVLAYGDRADAGGARIGEW